MVKLTKLMLCMVMAFYVGQVATAQGEKGFHLIDVPAPSLKNNLVGTKDVQKVGIYLPPSYYKSKKSYPVVYNLTGYTVKPGQYPPSGWLDSIMENKLVQEMIYVEISGYNMFQGTMYANSPVTGNWEDFVVKDVVSFIDKNYRTLAKRESRGISGHSMGGGGTFNISLKHADVFSVAYPMSPAIATKDSLMASMFGDLRIMGAFELLEKALTNAPKEKYAETLAVELKKMDQNILWVIGYGAAFAPDMSKALKFVLPFEKKNGKYVKNEKNWEKWEAGFGNIEAKVKKYKQNLLSYKHFSVDCGYSDNIRWILSSTKDLAKLLTENKIPHSVHLYDGDHVNRVGYQMANRTMTIMSTYLEKE